jgi:MoaA/NifB/PqqE/SkfB family radical SAM enzyme
LRHQLLLTVNAVVHRANIDRIGNLVDLALALGASRIEIAHVQYYGWALKNRAALMPTREQVERAAAAVEELRAPTTAASSLTPSSRTTTPAFQSLASAAGAGARST